MPPTSVLGKLIAPLVGAVNVPQSFTAQVGAVPLQDPSGWHVRVAAPVIVFPASQAYVAVAPKVSVGAATVPPVGPARAGQLAMTQAGELPLQVPSAWQVRVEDPEGP